MNNVTMEAAIKSFDALYNVHDTVSKSVEH